MAFFACANGATRWIQLPGFQFQPSEFFKPMFIVTTAWLLALRFDDRSLPTMEISFGLLLVVAALLIKQPDFGQTATGKASKLALRPAFGRPDGRFLCFPGSSPTEIWPGSTIA